ncbi:UNVERIFIED_CONTAM: hypothetical protein GTU68_016055 [Idotea baltica]|nr:hypothetical protein [Idotea baltica]
MKIAISGCGIGGLAAAILLHEQGHEITLFDQFSTSAPVGSGLVIQPVGQRVLARLGILDHCKTKGAKIYHMLGHETKRNRAVLNVAYGDKGGVDYGLGIHRATLFDALWTRAISCGINIQNNHKITQSSVDKSARFLSFESGSLCGPYDLVIDATGANSPISPMRSRNLSYGAIWGTVNWPENCQLERDHLRQKYHRAKNMIGILPLGSMPNDNAPKAAIFWSLPQDQYDRWREAPLANWMTEAMQLWPEVEPFISQITSHDDMTMARYEHGTLRHAYSDRLVHIGDAAHRASPQLGQGANMALLDAYALAKSLSQSPVDEALHNYARARRWHIGIYQMMSWAFTPMYQSNSRLLPWMRDWLLAPASQIPPVPFMLSHLVKGTMISPHRGMQ